MTTIKSAPGRETSASAAGAATPVRVSVVVPTRDRPGLLQEALDSIYAVAGPDLSLEVLICDNGCSPDVQEIATRRGARYLPVQENGAAAARNAGMAAATGEYLAFLDDDDLWLPEHLRGHLALLAARPELDAVVGQVILTDLERRHTTEPWPASLPEDGYVFGQFLNEFSQIGATVARVGVRDTVGNFDGSVADDEDWDWHLRLSLRHRIGFVPIPCVLFRQRPTGSFDELQWSRIDATFRVYFRHLAQAGSQRPSVVRAARSYFRHRWMYYDYFTQSAIVHLADHDRSAAWTSLKRAMLVSPIHAARDLGRAGGFRDAVRGLLRGKPPARELSHAE